jgi:hypothetical protein
MNSNARFDPNITSTQQAEIVMLRARNSLSPWIVYASNELVYPSQVPILPPSIYNSLQHGLVPSQRSELGSHGPLQPRNARDDSIDNFYPLPEDLAQLLNASLPHHIFHPRHARAAQTNSLNTVVLP